MAGEFVRVGQIVGAFGLKGELKVEPLTDADDRFLAGTRLRLNGDWVTVKSMRMHKGRPLVKIDGIEDMTAAEKLRWQYLEAPPLTEAEMEEGEYLVEDLIGMKVITVEGDDIGKVEDVLPYPAQDVLKVGDVLIPMVEEFVIEVDLEKEIITVKLLPGMLGD